MSASNPESLLTKNELLAIANFRTDRADSLDAALADGGSGAASTEYVSAQASGCTGDGVTDDSANAIAGMAVAAALGRRFHFEKGTYNLAALVSIDATAGMQISGSEATILYASTARKAFAFSADSTRVTVRDLFFQGEVNDDKNANGNAALDFSTNGTDIDVRGCTFRYCRPVQVAGDYAKPGRFSFKGNRVFNAPDPISTSQYSIITGNWFINDEQIDTRSHAVYIFGSPEGCIITDNIFEKIAHEDIQIRASAARFDQKFNFVICDNYFTDSGQTSIWCGSETTTNSGGFTIMGNSFRNCNGCVLGQGLRDSIIVGNSAQWDWEYAGGRSNGGSAISVTSGGAFAQRYGMSTGVVVADNQLTQRHPYFGVVVLDELPVDGETITVGSITYTWRDTPSTAGDVAIVALDIPDTLGALQNAILGTSADSFNDTNPVVRDASDVFYNGFLGNVAPNDTLVIVSHTTFALSTTAADTTITAVIDNRDSCAYGLLCNYTLWPLVTGNMVADFISGAALQWNRSPTFSNNVIKGGSPVVGTGNALSVYRGNHFPDADQSNTSTFRKYRQLLVKDGFPVIVDNGLINAQEYTTLELMGASGRVTVGNGKARTFFFFGADQYGDGDVNTEPFSWRDGDTVEFRGSGKANLDLTFKRVAPGAGEFNSRATFITAVNASSDWDAAAAAFVDVGGTGDPGMMVELTMAAAGALVGDPRIIGDNPYRVHVTTRSKTCGVILNVDGETYTPFLGGCAGTLGGLGATRTAIFSPLASDCLPVWVQGIDADSHALDPVCYLADAIGGVGWEITHAETITGTEGVAFHTVSQ